MKNLTKLSLIIMLSVTTIVCHAQWSNSTFPKLTTGYPTIERGNPYLRFNNTGVDDAGGIWYQNDGANTFFQFYNLGANRVDWQQGQTTYNGNGILNQFTFDLDLPDAGATTEGAFTIGNLNNHRMTFDVNEIQTKNASGVSPLYLNHEGGNVEVNGGSTTGDFIVGIENAFVVDNSEKWVSIGASSPLDNLHIKGTNQTIGAFTFNVADIRLEANHGKYLRFYEGTTSKGYVGHTGTHLQITNTEVDGNVVLDAAEIEMNIEGSPAMNIDNSGRVEITKANEALRLSGSNSWISFNNGPSYNGYLYHSNVDMYLSNNLSNGKLHLLTSGVERATIASNGNFGIGTLNPAFKLEIMGDVNVTGELTAASDMRLKKNINELENALELINKLNPVSYEFRVDEFPTMDLVNRRKMGLIAQEVEAVLPNLVSNAGTTTHADGKEVSIKSVNYMELVPLLVEAIQELEQQLTIANQQISSNEESMASMRNRLVVIEAILMENKKN